MKIFIEGFIQPFKAFKMFFRYPRILLHSFVPLLINATIYLISFLYFYILIIEKSEKLTGSTTPDAGFFSEFMHIVIVILSFFIVLMFCYFITLIIGGIISAPFNENISLIIEENLTGIKSEYNPGFWLDIWLNIKSELKKLSFYFSILFVFFLIGFIPLIGSIISVVLSTLFSFFFNALDFLDYPMTRRYMTLKKKIKTTFSKFSLSLGFGCATFLLMFLPVINIILKPVCVVSGTMLYFQKGYGKSKVV